jgi:hypothetical protein
MTKRKTPAAILGGVRFLLRHIAANGRARWNGPGWSIEDSRWALDAGLVERKRNGYSYAYLTDDGRDTLREIDGPDVVFCSVADGIEREEARKRATTVEMLACDLAKLPDGMYRAVLARSEAIRDQNAPAGVAGKGPR